MFFEHIRKKGRGRVGNRPMHCNKCGKLIDAGEHYWTKRTARKRGQPIYYFCKQCYESLFVEC